MRLTAKSQYTLTMIMIGILTALLVGSIAWASARDSIRSAEFAHLTGIRTGKATQIENYFQTVRNQLTVMAEDPTIVAAMVQLGRGFKDLGESEITPEIEMSIEAYYTEQFIPRLTDNTVSGTPEFNTFRPVSQSARYLQYQFISNNRNAVGFKHFLDDPQDGSDYSQFHLEYHDNLRDFLLTFGYYDLFLVDFDTGDLVYSVYKEADYGTNLVTGAYRNSGLGTVVQQVMRDPIRRSVQIVDYQPYAPSYNAPAAFVAAPIYNGEHTVGIIALQLPVDRIDDIMTGYQMWESEGLGQSGETYLVGSDTLMRSNSRFLLQDNQSFFSSVRTLGVPETVVTLMEKLDTTILLQKIDTEGVRLSTGGETDTRTIFDYRGVSVLSSFAPLNIQGLDWVILSEIDATEAFAPVQRLFINMLIGAAIFIPFVALASIWLAQRFLQPMRGLINSGKQIIKSHQEEESGLSIDDDFEEELDLTFSTAGAPEFSELGMTMNGVIDIVQARSEMATQKHSAYTDMLLRSLPESVAERYQNGEQQIIDSSNKATAFFLTIRGFRSLFKVDSPDESLHLYQEIDGMIAEAATALGIDVFDQLDMEYVGICGLTTPYLNHTERCVQFAQAVAAVTKQFNEKHAVQLQFQIGIDVGPLVGSLLDTRKIAYEVWGHTLYIAREANKIADRNQVVLTDVAQQQLPNNNYVLTQHNQAVQFDDDEFATWHLDVMQREPVNASAAGAGA